MINIRKFSIIFIVIFSIIPLVSGYEINDYNFNLSLNQNNTFIVGTLFSPIESNSTINANAISLVYFNYYPMNNQIGLVQGFKKVSFEKQKLFYLYSPGPMGLISYVFGYCSNFEIK
jgi:hypothetical protein